MTTSTASAQPKSYFEDDAEVLRPMISSADRVGLAELGQRLVDIRAFMQDDLNQLESDIGDTWTELRTRSDRAARHILSLPGKRIRPLCVLLAARMNGLPMTPAIRSVSLACELVHAATLLHDDVLDQGTERRGLTTARLLFGNSASVLGGDHLLVNALRRVNLSTSSDITQSLLDCIAVMVEAEAIQLDRRGIFEPSREVYHEVIYGKTASIFEWGMGSGAQLAGASDEISEAMATVGRKIGMAFQVVDDVLDLSVDAETLGKNEWADLKEGKLTWPLIIACERDPGLVEAFREVVERDLEPTQALRERVLATGCVEEARKYARSLGDDAKVALAKCPGGQARDALEAVIETVVRRGS